MPAPIEVHYWPTPNGWKVTIALEEMGLPYTVKPVNIGKGEQFTPEFLAISPNNRMPAIVDPEGPGGAPLSVFESGAILQYLARKTGLFNGGDDRGRAEVESWLMWQMGGLGPMAGQAHHFRQYAPTIEPDPEKVAYGQTRYTNEVNRLYGVLNKRLADREFVAGPLSIADFAIWPWVVPWQMQGQNLDDFAHLRAWFERCRARDAFQKGFAVGAELRRPLQQNDKESEEARKILFGQTAASIAAKQSQ
jgi:glutathione S-transferase/GST-like protein